MQSVPEQQGPYGKGRPQSSPSQVRGDPTSPTRVEQGLGRNNDVPLPPGTPSSGSRRVGNEGQQSQQHKGFLVFRGQCLIGISSVRCLVRHLIKCLELVQCLELIRCLQMPGACLGA